MYLRVNQSSSGEDSGSPGMYETLKNWISKFLANNTQIISSLVGRNVLIDQVRSTYT